MRIKSVLAGLAAVLVAVAATGQTQKKEAVDLSFLPEKWRKGFKISTMDEQDVKILRNNAESEHCIEGFQRIMSYPDWRRVDPSIKKRMVDGGEIPEIHKVCAEIAIRCGDVLIQENAGELAFAVARLTPQSVWGWEERPKRTEEYVALTDELMDKLSAEDKDFTKKLLFIINDYVHTFQTWPDKVPDQQAFKDGAMNARTVETGGAFFPPGDRATESAKRYWSVFAKGDGLHQFLASRKIPDDVFRPDLRELYDKLGYIYRLSDFEGLKIHGYLPGTTHNGKIPIIEEGFLSWIKITNFTNGVLPVRSVPGNASRIFTDFQKKKREAAVEGLKTTLQALTRDKALTAGQREVATLIQKQFNAVMSQKKAEVNRGAAMTHARQGETVGGSR